MDRGDILAGLFILLGVGVSGILYWGICSTLSRPIVLTPGYPSSFTVTGVSVTTNFNISGSGYSAATWTAQIEAYNPHDKFEVAYHRTDAAIFTGQRALASGQIVSFDQKPKDVRSFNASLHSAGRALVVGHVVLDLEFVTFATFKGDRLEPMYATFLIRCDDIEVVVAPSDGSGKSDGGRTWESSCLRNMKASRECRKQEKLLQRGCKALCCSCRLSVSSSKESESSSCDPVPTISSLAHAMVQERLDQMIRERQEARQRERRRQNSEGAKFIIMAAMEKCSSDPREDFRVSMVEMILANKLDQPKDLRSLLNYYMSMNSQEYHGTILEVFHEVCTNLFLCCK
ncbi:hypothetical protein Tsubulata_047931 [Turnera subulata]|uniref:Transcription repressor n=1 Tax=Turnera subulata TaxID=218843 RepID=A0A9Q0FVZ9_9ROSI|nr:hypothetical protein Tsubulata_047931 [Turnera subulata]